jgi:hypothetical protein
MDAGEPQNRSGFKVDLPQFRFSFLSVLDDLGTLQWFWCWQTTPLRFSSTEIIEGVPLHRPSFDQLVPSSQVARAISQ